MTNGLTAPRPYPMEGTANDPLIERLKKYQADLKTRLVKVEKALRALDKCPEVAATMNAISEVDWR